MQLIEPNPVHVVSSGEVLTQEFGIGSIPLMIKYMTESIYSNKIYAICRETMSNARDANTENSNPHIPITVKLPNDEFPTWEVSDHGLGMNPERIKKTFLFYGGSTKRSDNSQIGGFGIGAKTPWCYSEVFNITTIVLENGNYVRYQYSAVKGDTHTNPKLISLNPPEIVPAEENPHTGTKIIINVDPEDFGSFISETKKTCEFWDVRPTIIGQEFQYNDYEYSEQNSEFALVKIQDYYFTSRIILAGIPYNLNLNNLKLPYNTLLKIKKIKFFLYFNVGEVDVVLNREELDYTERTIEKINSRIQTILDTVNTIITARVAEETHVFSAMTRFRSEMTAFSENIFETIQWRGMEIGFFKYSLHHLMNSSRYSLTHQGKLIVSGNSDLGIPEARTGETFQYVLIDDASNVKKKVKYLLNNGAKYVYTVMMPSRFVDDATEKEFNEWKVRNHFDTIEFLKLSEIVIPKKPRTKYDAEYERRSVVKYYRYVGDFHALTDEENMELNDDDKEVCYYVEVERRNPIGLGYETLNRLFNMIMSLDEDKRFVIYGVPSRFIKNLGDQWVRINKDSMEEMLTDLFYESLSLHAYYLGKYKDNMFSDALSLTLQNMFENNLERIENEELKTSYLNEKDLTTNHKPKHKLHERIIDVMMHLGINRPNYDDETCPSEILKVVEVCTKFKKQTPILENISYHYDELDKALVDDLIMYVNMKIPKVEEKILLTSTDIA